MALLTEQVSELETGGELLQLVPDFELLGWPLLSELDNREQVAMFDLSRERLRSEAARGHGSFLSVIDHLLFRHEIEVV